MFFHSLETGIGYDIVLWFQGWRSSFVSGLFLPFSWLISEGALLALLPLIYWCYNKNKGKRLIQTLLVSFMINTWFKTILARPRPYQIAVPGKPAVTPALRALDSHGIPSGHTQGGVTLFGFFARESGSGIFSTVMIILMILTGISRLVHGMHFPQDVLGGALLGTAVIFLYPPVMKYTRSITGNFVLAAQIILTLLLLLGLSAFAVLTIKEYEAKKAFLSLAAVYSSGLAGFILEDRYIRFSTRGTFVKVILRYITGLAAAVIIYLGLKFIFKALNPADNKTLEMVLTVVRYVSLGLWISAGAPALFIKLGLSSRG